MRHARPDYERFQDPEGKIPDDEPVFLVRGQDLAGPATLRSWVMLARSYGADEDILERVSGHAEAMENWQRSVASKVPDL